MLSMKPNGLPCFDEVIQAMNIVIVAHVGETLGHVIRGLSIAEALRARGASVVFVTSTVARQIVQSRGFEVEPNEWSWSHNASSVDDVTPDFARKVLRTMTALGEVLRRRQPDLAIGVPGLASIQPAWAAGVEHVSLVHGPYLAPLVDVSGLDDYERRIVSLAARVCLGSVNQMFRLAHVKLRLPAMNYDMFVSKQRLLVPHPGYPFAGPSNIRRVGFIRASYGGPVPPDLDLGRTCYVTFGSGNPCDISQIVNAASEVFEHVLVTTGMAAPPLTAPRNAVVRSDVASAAIAGRAQAVVTHGGLGTIGTFARSGTPQLIIPTELDQAVTAVFAVHSGIARQYGLEHFAMRTRLGRQLPQFDPASLRAAVGRLREGTQETAVESNGAADVAALLTGATQDLSPRGRSGAAG